MFLPSRLRILIGAVSAAAFFSPVSAAPTAISRQELKQGFINGRLLAKPKSATKDDQLSEQEARTGVKLHGLIKGQTAVRVLEFSPKTNLRQTAAQLRASGLYDYVEPDFIRRPHAVPNDPQFGTQWGLSNTGQQDGTVSADIAAVPAWDKRHDAPNVIVAIIDSGLRPTHEDLAANLWTNPNPAGDGYLGAVHGINTFVEKGTAGDGDISDNEGHGTAVASVIGAVGNNGAGISGVAWKVQLMPLKFNDASEVALSSNEIICINFAVAHGAKIINFSYGSHGYSQAEYDAISAARNAGVIFVASAGNDGLPFEMAGVYPAGYFLDNIVTVANTDRTDTLASSSNFGNVVDLAAPGTDITVCSKDGNSSYDTLSGTSFSAPAVSGALALLSAQYPGDNYRQLINRLSNSTTHLNSLAGHVGTGGRLNLNQALSSTSNLPFNNNFANAAVLAPYWARARASSKGATVENKEPNHGANGGASLWWTWVPGASGTAYVDTTGSDFDTIAAIYTGTQLANLTKIASNDDAPGLNTSRVTFNALAGTTYYIAVDGKNGATGEVSLAVDLAAPNDSFASAYALAADLMNAYTTDTLRFATSESGEPPLTVGSSTGTGHSLWYTYQPQATGPMTASVYTESFEPIVGVYTGTALSNLVNVGTGIESAAFNATAGQTYYIKVDTIDNVGAFFINMVSSYDAIPLATSIYSSPAVDSNGNVVTIDSASVIGYFTPGSESGSWENQLFQGSVGFNSPAIDTDGSFYVTSSTGAYKISPNQSILWSKSYAGTSGSSASPGIANDGTVYIHSDDGTLHAYTSSGVEKWAAQVPGSSMSSPAIGVDGTIYIGSDDHHLYAVNPVDGTLNWAFDAAASIQASPALDSSGNIYFGTLGSQFFCVSPDGSKQFGFAVNDKVYSSAAIDNRNHVIFGVNDGSLYQTDISGSQAILQRLDDAIYSSPTLGADHTISVGSASGVFYQMGPNQNATTQTWQTAGSIFSSPTIAPASTGNSIVFGSVDHKVYYIPTITDTAQYVWPTFRADPARTGRAKSQLVLPIIHAVTSSQAFGPGTSPVLSVAAEGSGTLTYAWSFNGTPMGVTAGSLVLSNFSASMAGTYTVTVTNGNGSVTSDPIVITEQAPADHSAGPGRIINLSARAYTGDDANRLIVGLIVGSGTGLKPILVRGVGPSLGPRGVTTFIDDPALNVYTGSEVTSSNDNWGTEPAVPTASTVVGAVPLVTPQDSALLAHLTPGGYTAQVVGGSISNGNGGVALAEFYDASPSIASDTPLLKNISARAFVGQGDQVLIIGFIIGGNSPVKVLLRGLGPELVHQGVPNVLADPSMRLVDQSDGSTVSSNDNWSDASNVSDIQAAISQVGAPAFDAGSKDAAIVTTLSPGGYTVVISGVNGATGIGLAELFTLPN